MAHSTQTDAAGRTEHEITTDGHIVQIREGERKEYTIEEFFDAYPSAGSSKLSILARTQGMLAGGTLIDEVRDNENVVERALQEDDVFFAEIAVPFWFRNQDEEVGDTFGDDDRIFALVENYSEKAFRIIASERGTPGDTLFVYEWTFVPKSLVTVTRVVGVEDRLAGEDFGTLAFREMEARREAEDARFEAADGWEEKLAVIDGDD